MVNSEGAITPIHKRLSSGDHEAFRLFFDHYHPKLYAYIFKVVKSKEVAEELVMDIFVKIWSAKEILNDVENADAFLYRMAVNKALNFMKAASREKKLRLLLYDTLQRETHTSTTQYEVKEFEQRLNQCIEMLSNQQQLVVSLSRKEGLTHEQIATRLNLSRNTVKNHMVSAMKNLRNILKNGYLSLPFSTALYLFFHSH